MMKIYGQDGDGDKFNVDVIGLSVRIVFKLQVSRSHFVDMSL